MEGLTPPVNGDTPEYQPIGNCESDDSRSNASRSDDNEGVPGIIYTSDDSADVGQSDSTYVDSDAPQYYAQNVEEAIEDQLSQQCLLSSNSPTPSLPPTTDCFATHPLSPINISNRATGKEIRRPSQCKSQLFVDHPKIHLNVNPGESLGLTRCNSASSSSTEPEFTPEAPFLCEYEPLSCYPDDEGYGGGLNFEAMKDDPIKSQVIHEQLNMLTAASKEVKHKTRDNKILVAGVLIDAAYKDAFYVKWNWLKIRQSCVFISISFLIALLCISIGLLIQMPQKCDPVQQWWQGSVSYYIYVPSFQDSDGDGFGDITGVIQRLDYLEGLGVKNVRLGNIFETDNGIRPSSLPQNYSTVSSLLGDEEDLQLLAALLHERNMFITLDFPLLNPMEEEEPTVVNASRLVRKTPVMELTKDVSMVLHKWIELGVDGFVFTDLDQLWHMDHLVESLRSWRSVLNRKSRRPHRRILAVPMELLAKLESEVSPDLTYILNLVDLIDVHLNINQSTEKIALDINAASRWDNHASYPWINWNLGGIGYKRISGLLPFANPFSFFEGSSFFSPTLGPTLFQLFLPGSVTLFYADEINAQDVDDPTLKDANWASLMHWSPKAKNGGFSNGNPWLTSKLDWTNWNAASLNLSIEALRTMIKARQSKVPLYINGLFDDVGDYHPKKTNNYKIKLASNNIFIMDRYYPRRNKFTIVINFSSETIKKDLSQLYYGGSVLASSHGKSGYIKFQEIILRPGEALACVMDK